MGRKSALKKANPDRHKAFIALRKMGNTSESFTTKDGAEIMINPVKRFLLRKDYKNPEFQKELGRKAQRYAEALKPAKQDGPNMAHSVTEK